MSEKKMVRRSVAIALGIICIILAASLGAVTYMSYSPTKGSSVTDLQNQINDLNATYNSYVSTHSHTDDEYDTIQTNYQNELNQYSSYVSEHSYTNGQYDSLNSQNTNLNSQVGNLNNQINQLNTQINQLNLSVNQYILYADNFASLHNGVNGVYLTDTQISNYYGAGLNWAIDANATINNLLGTCSVTLTFITQDYTFTVNPSTSATVTMHWESMYQHGVSLSIKSVSR
jgi:uncharacterized phage infection (PIP) family protein YhgE